MVLTSRLKAVEDALKAAIQAQAAGGGSPLAGVAIRLGNPGSGRKAEHVWISEDASAEQTWEVSAASAATATKAEVVSLAVFVYVQKAGDDYEAVRDRLQAMIGEVEQAVSTDPTLQGVAFDAEVTKIDRAGGRHEKGWMMAAEVSVRITDYL